MIEEATIPGRFAPVYRKGKTMAIDDSVVTYSVFAICAAASCIRTYKKTKNTLRTAIMFLWAAAIYLVVSCSIFPIQLENIGGYFISYTEMFSMMSLEHLTKYFPGYFIVNIEYFSSYLLLSFFGHLLFPKMRKIWVSATLLLGLMIIHVIYNVSLNVLTDELVKYINAEDLYLITLGFAIGWLCGKLTFKIWPTLSEKIAKKCGE